MNQQQVEKVRAVVTGVQQSVDAVVEVLDAAGVGGHLNESQAHSLFDAFASMALVALKAYHEAQGVPITAESVLALLPDRTPLPLPPDVGASATVETPADVMHNGEPVNESLPPSE